MKQWVQVLVLLRVFLGLLLVVLHLLVLGGLRAAVITQRLARSLSVLLILLLSLGLLRDLSVLEFVSNLFIEDVHD